MYIFSGSEDDDPEWHPDSNPNEASGNSGVETMEVIASTAFLFIQNLNQQFFRLPTLKLLKIAWIGCLPKTWKNYCCWSRARKWTGGR